MATKTYSHSKNVGLSLEDMLETLRLGQGGGMLDSETYVQIKTQAEFETYFGNSFGDTGAAWWGTSYYGQTISGGAIIIPENTLVILSPIAGDINTSGSYDAGKGAHGDNTYNGKPAYILRNKVYLKSGAKIIGWDKATTTIIRNDGDATNEDNIKFYTSYKYTTAVTGVSTNDFTVGDSSNYNIGDLVQHSQDYGFYTIIDIPDGTSIIVDKDITGSASGNLRSMITGVRFEGWGYDGRGGVNGLGGALTDANQYGGAFYTLYLGKSMLNCEIVNHNLYGGLSDIYGAAIYGGRTCYRIIAENIYSCRIESDAENDDAMGIVYGLYNSKIKVCYCEAQGGTAGNDGDGGTAYIVMYCYHSDIEVRSCNSYGGEATGPFVWLGGGSYLVYSCQYSTIRVIQCLAKTTSSWPNTNFSCRVVDGCHYSRILVIYSTASGLSNYTPAITANCNHSLIRLMYCTAGNAQIRSCDSGSLKVWTPNGGSTEIFNDCTVCDEIWTSATTGTPINANCNLGGTRQT